MCFPDVYEIEMLNTKYTPISVNKIILSLYNLNHKYFTYEKEDRPLYAHQNETDEILYLQENLLKPIEKAGAATFQTDLERFAYQKKDAFTEIDKRLAKRRYLLGDIVTEADKLLYQTLLRHDYIYYYLYKLNFAKSFDFENIARYVTELKEIPEIADSIQIEEEKKKAYLGLEEAWNPYRLVFDGPGARI